jgi:hypothetical protein
MRETARTFRTARTRSAGCKDREKYYTENKIYIINSTDFLLGREETNLNYFYFNDKNKNIKKEKDKK